MEDKKPLENTRRTHRIAELERRIDLIRQRHAAGMISARTYIKKTKGDALELHRLYQQIIDEQTPPQPKPLA